MKTEEKGREDDVKHAGCGSASAPLRSVPPGSDAASPLHLKKTTSPWQPQRTCAHLPARGAVLYVCMHECVLCKHIGSSVTACVPPSDVSLSVSRCVCVCVFISINCRRVCVCVREIHTNAHTEPHIQFVLQALFLARGTYIIRVTLGEIKGRGKTSLAFSSPSICFSSSTFSLFCSLSSCFSRPSFALSGLSSPVLPVSLFI